MSFNNINTKLRSENGFTIVELLIVIVVIGILAAITIVSFNGVTAKANTASSQAAANTAIKKFEAYNAEMGTYPTTTSLVTGADATKTYQLTGVNFNTVGTNGTAQTAAPVVPSGQTYSASSILNFLNCGTGNGAAVQYYNFQTSAWISLYTGGASLSNCPPSKFQLAS